MHTQLNILFEYSAWILEKKPDLGITIFTCKQRANDAKELSVVEVT